MGEKAATVQIDNVEFKVKQEPGVNWLYEEEAWIREYLTKNPDPEYWVVK